MVHNKSLFGLLICSLAIGTTAFAMSNTHNFSVVPSDESRDHAEVLQMIEADWDNLYKGKAFQAEFVLQHLINAADNKWLDVARSNDATQKPAVLGFITSCFFAHNPQVPGEGGRQRGYIELLTSLASQRKLSVERRKEIERALMQFAMNRIKPKSPELFETFVMPDDAFSIDLCKEFGFEPSGRKEKWGGIQLVLPVTK